MTPSYPLPPEGTELGRLHLALVFDYFDYPQIFTCGGDSGRQFLALHVEEHPSPDTWLYVRLGPERMKEMLAGRVDLCDALLHAEDGFVFRVIQDLQSATAAVDRVGPTSLPEEWLPLRGQKLAPAVLRPGSRPQRFEIAPGPTAQAPHLAGAFAIATVTNHDAFVPRVRAWVSFKSPSIGTLFDGAEMEARWSSAPEPVTPVQRGTDSIAYLPDPSKLPVAFVQDFARMESQSFAIAIKLADGTWGFTPESYFHGFKHPRWRLPAERLEVTVRVRADGIDYRRALMLDTAVATDAFRVEATGEGTVAEQQPAATEQPSDGQPPTSHLRLVPDAA